MANKKYLKETVKNRLIENEIAIIETSTQIKNNIPHYDNNHHEDTISHKRQCIHDRSKKENINCYKEGEDIAAYEENNIATNDEVEERNVEFESMFKKLDSTKKWILSTGKCVDNELYMFGLQCTFDHPSRSLIIDPYDDNYISYNIFTREELEEIVMYQKKKYPIPSDELKLFMNKYNLDNTEEIRAALEKYHTFQSDYNKDKNADRDWVNFVVYSLVREYENGNMDRPHHEAWYQSHIWSMIESCFDKLKNVEAVVGESACLGTKRRKNDKRHINAISPMPRLKSGYKCDLIFRQYQNKHSIPLEFGASEAKPNIEDESGTKYMQEGLYKLPRVLKDMLDYLLQEINFDDRSKSIRTVGFLHSGLSSTMIELDRPTTYISRVSRSKAIAISPSVSKFGSTVLPALLSTWVCREIVKEVLQIVSSGDKVNSNDISWFEDCLERPTLPQMP